MLTVAQSYSGTRGEPFAHLAPRSDERPLADPVAVEVGADRGTPGVERVAPVGALWPPADPVAVEVSARRQKADKHGKKSEHGGLRAGGS